MPEPTAPEEAPPGPQTRDIQIGGGDPVRIASFREIAYRQATHDPTSSEAYERDLPPEALDEATALIANLPFRFGSIEHIGTLSRRVLEAEVILSPRAVAYNAPESEQAKQRLVFRFGRDAGVGLSLNTHNNLSVEHRPTGEINNATIIRFSPESTLRVAGREIGEVTLVIPVEPPPAK